MTPQEKAEELMNEFINYVDCYINEEYSPRKQNEFQKKCALIAVDEIIAAIPFEPSDVDWEKYLDAIMYGYQEKFEKAFIYWEEVKQEINKL